MSPERYKGSCFCGSVEIEVVGPPMQMGYCHCNSCRAHSGGPLAAFMLWKSDDVRVVAGESMLGRFNKVGISDRHFCRLCGGHLITRHPGLDLTDVRAGVMPDIAFRPDIHLHYAESVLPVRDGLPKLKDFPAEVGGSGESMSE